jgi:protein-disulfide isomerase
MTETPPEAPRPRQSMLDRFNPGWAALAVSLVALILAAAPFVSGGMTGPVRNALLNNPEILREASERLQQQELAAVQAAARAAIAQNLPALNDDPRDPAIGPEDARVTVVQFFDYRCPYCKQIADEYMALVEANPDVRFVFKEWPILDRDEPLSEFAARAALAAERQGRYARVHQALMAAQTIDQAGVEAILQGAGLDMEQARADIAAADTGQHLSDVMSLARTIGASGTPTFIVNGQMLEARSARDIQDAINLARQSAGSEGAAPSTAQGASADQAADAAR